MSAQNPSTFVEFWKNLPIPWLVGGPNGQNEANALGTLMDQRVALLKQSAKVGMPDYAPIDALQHIGGDRQLVQGANETNASFITRCKDPWSQWARAGTALSVLEQLAYYGLTGAYWVQQNGLMYNLSAAPTAGVDPTALLVTTNLPALANTLTSSLNPSRTIPAGTPWWFFDANTDLCNRFAIVVPTWPFSALVPANFTNTDSAAVTWPFTFANTSYSIIVGPPTDNVTLHADLGTVTTTGVTIRSSAAWTGTAWITAYASGVNPLNVFTSASAGIIKKIIKTWRPNALCMGVIASLTGIQWDFPITDTWDGGGLTWGNATVNTIVAGAF